MTMTLTILNWAQHSLHQPFSREYSGTVWGWDREGGLLLAPGVYICIHTAPLSELLGCRAYGGMCVLEVDSP